MHFSSPILCCLAVLTAPIFAHPGHDLSQEIEERATFIEATKRSDLSHCAAKLKERGLEKRNAVRRSATVKSSMQKRGLKKRDLATVLATSHNETSAGYTTNTSEDTLFSGNNSCILTPEVTQGPYYVAGEYYRRDVRESQEGVDLVIDTQVIDVDTCEPVPDVHIEIWHCNSTGVYSGIVASGNGVGSSDPSNINATFLRGVQTTDSDGVAQFETVFPGHYTGRATHVHVMVHMNGTVRANNTWSGAVAAHVGQMFFDQTLISQVEAVTPYSTNTQTLTENADDSILSSETENDVDPMMEYTLLGDSIEDGLFAWLAFGINTTYATTITPAATLYASGGVENASSGSPGGNGTTGNGTFPSGAGFNSSALPPTSTAV